MFHRFSRAAARGGSFSSRVPIYLAFRYRVPFPSEGEGSSFAALLRLSTRRLCARGTQQALLSRRALLKLLPRSWIWYFGTWTWLNLPFSLCTTNRGFIPFGACETKFSRTLHLKHCYRWWARLAEWKLNPCKQTPSLALFLLPFWVRWAPFGPLISSVARVVQTNPTATRWGLCCRLLLRKYTTIRSTRPSGWSGKFN